MKSKLTLLNLQLELLVLAYQCLYILLHFSLTLIPSRQVFLKLLNLTFQLFHIVAALFSAALLCLAKRLELTYGNRMFFAFVLPLLALFLEQLLVDVKVCVLNSVLLLRVQLSKQHFDLTVRKVPHFYVLRMITPVFFEAFFDSFFHE